MTLRLPRLPQTPPTHAELQVWWQQVCEAIETQEGRQDEAIEAIQAAQEAADAANLAADTANEAAESVTAESSLVNSYVANFTAPLIQADDTGDVTIADHDRIYGNGDVVSVDGDVVATALTNPDVARIFYSDPGRAGGAVVYQFSEDAADAAQTGDIHSVGAVEIPAAGTSPGGHVQPPGYVNPLP